MEKTTVTSFYLFSTITQPASCHTDLTSTLGTVLGRTNVTPWWLDARRPHIDREIRLPNPIPDDRGRYTCESCEAFEIHPDSKSRRNSIVNSRRRALSVIQAYLSQTCRTHRRRAWHQNHDDIHRPRRPITACLELAICRQPRCTFGVSRRCKDYRSGSRSAVRCNSSRLWFCMSPFLFERHELLIETC